MRLKQHHDAPAAGAELRRSECGANLCRVMTVVINDEHVVDFTLRLEPASGAGEAVQTFDDLFERHFEFEPNCDRRERVVDVMHTRHAQDHLAYHVRTAPDSERRSEVIVVTNAMSRNVSLRAETVSHAAAFEERNDCLHVRIVET